MSEFDEGEPHRPGTDPGATRVPCSRFPRTADCEDSVAVEEPLEIRLEDDAFATIMRTPGSDRDLALGFLYSEGVIDSISDVGTLTFCARDSDVETANVVQLRAPDGVELASPGGRRHGPSVSSCGVCGKQSIDEVLALPPPPTVTGKSHDRSDPWLSLETLVALPDRLRGPQRLFEITGAIHAAAIFDAMGEACRIREDIGRHNAVDKTIGAALLEDALPLERRVLQVSGRVSFEIVQKAYRAGIPVISAVSGVSSLAVDLAGEVGITLAGFVRDGRCNVYVDAGHLSSLDELPR